ncbi:MAG: hypothetical protein R3C68_10705 [Myxococcota bacterium]
MFKYQPYYCEENAWWLCQHPNLGDVMRWVVFISNTQRACLMWQQRAAQLGSPILWDYHVVVMTPGLIWDLDTRLATPAGAGEYLQQTFLHLSNSYAAEVPQNHLYAPQFRVVAAADYIGMLQTDRSHMRQSDGTWRHPPPPWPPMNTPGHPSNLQSFIDMTTSGVGNILSLEDMLSTYGFDP